MRPQSCKAKGRVLQNKIAADILRAFPRLRDNDVRSVSMGCNGEDIVLSPLAESIFPYSVEAKNQEKLNIWTSLKQARDNCPGSRTPLLVFKRNHETCYAAMPWDAFLRLQQSAASGANVETLPEQPEGDDAAPATAAAAATSTAAPARFARQGELRLARLELRRALERLDAVDAHLGDDAQSVRVRPAEPLVKEN
jgi:hypothetical protein